MNDAPRLSALVVTYHTGASLKECLAALAADPLISEIILADNGNPPDMQVWIDDFMREQPRAKLIRKGDNPGFGTAVNRCAAAASGTHFLVLNPDAILAPGALTPLIAALQNTPPLSIAGGRILDEAGREARGARRATLTLAHAIGLKQWTFENDPLPDHAIEVGAISGAFFLMRAEDYRRLGGFDEAYFLHVEDVDLCRRAFESGGRVLFVPGANARHYGATSDAPSSVVQAHKARSLARYFRKFAKGPVEKLLVELAVPFIRLVMKLR